MKNKDMSNPAERLGRAARRSDRLKVKIEMLPTLERNIPLTEPMNEEQIEKMDDASLSILEDVGCLLYTSPSPRD